MRQDFNKLLVERERIGHDRKFHESRRLRKLDAKDEDGQPLGGRESMRRRHKIADNQKSFNENLTPLQGWLRSCLGKNWDKCYSELRKTFDARGVINDHILQHLYQYIEVNAKLVDGKVMVINRYSGRRGYIPIADAGADYYVCPKTGCVKKTNRLTYKQRRRLDKRKAEEAEAKVHRIIDAENHLRLIDGIWYHFTMKKLPKPRIELHPPHFAADHLYQVQTYPRIIMKKWAELNQQERVKIGQKRVIGQAYDVFLKETIYLSDRWGTDGISLHRRNFLSRIKGQSNEYYHAEKQTASHKLLKQAGLV